MNTSPTDGRPKAAESSPAEPAWRVYAAEVTRQARDGAATQPQGAEQGSARNSARGGAGSDDPTLRRLSHIRRLVRLSRLRHQHLGPRLREAAASLLKGEPGSTQHGNLFLLRWMSLCLLTLLLLMIFLLSGWPETLEHRQLMLLCNEPFLMEAEKIQQPLLGPGGLFGLCVALTLYLSLVLLREPSWGRRTQLSFLAAVTAALPGLLCVFWGGLFNPAAPVLCIALLWLATSLIPFYCNRGS